MAYFHPDTHETRDPLIITTFFGVLALLSLIARLYVIHLRNSLPKSEEWMVIGALFLTYVSLGLQWACVTRGGTGRHVADVNVIDPTSITVTLKLIIPFEALYGVTIMLVKLAVLRFYERTFSLAKWFKLSMWITATAVCAWMISVVLETFLLCRPLAYNWDSSIDGVCGNRNVVYVIAGVTNLVTDVMVLLLPIPAIWQLKMPIGQKIGLITLFSLGVFITAISIVRLHSLMSISFSDPTWTLPMGLLWTVLEPELAIINANLPFLRRFVALVVPRAFSRSGNSKGYQTKTKGSKHVDFRKINENGIMLRTIGGGYAHRSAIVGGPTETQSSSNRGKCNIQGIVQERLVEVDFDSQYSVEIGSKTDSHERMV